MSLIRGSFITLALTRSLWARDLKTMYAKMTVSPALAFDVFRKRHAHLRSEIVADTLLIVEGAVLAPELRRLLRKAAIRLYVFLWNGQDVSVDVFHGHHPFLSFGYAFSGPLPRSLDAGI